MTETELKQMALKRLRHSTQQRDALKSVIAPRLDLLNADWRSDLLESRLYGATLQEIAEAALMSREGIRKILLKMVDNRVDKA